MKRITAILLTITMLLGTAGTSYANYIEYGDISAYTEGATVNREICFDEISNDNMPDIITVQDLSDTNHLTDVSMPKLREAKNGGDLKNAGFSDAFDSQSDFIFNGDLLTKFNTITATGMMALSALVFLLSQGMVQLQPTY